MRNDVPDSVKGQCVPSSGVERAAGGAKRSLIEHLRARIHVLEQGPVSLAFTPAPDAARLRPACSLPSLFSLPPHPDPLPEGERESEGTPHIFSSPHGGEGFPPRLGLPKPPGGKGEGENRDQPPLGRFKKGGLHEIKPASYRDAPAALAFALAAIGERVGAEQPPPLILWCLTAKAAHEWGRPYGPGLFAFGLDPACLLIVEARTELDAAWALEEGLKSRALTAALGQVAIEAPLLSRRLGLAAKSARTPCLLLSGHCQSALPGTVTRWRIEAQTSSGARFDRSAPGAPAWRLTLERCRGMPPRSWTVEFRHESHGFRLAAASGHRAAQTGESESPAYALTGTG